MTKLVLKLFIINQNQHGAQLKRNQEDRRRNQIKHYNYEEKRKAIKNRKYSRNAINKQKRDTLTKEDPNKLKEIEEIVKRLEEKNVEMKTEIN